MSGLDFLFQGRDLRDGLAEREAEAKRAAHQIPADHALARSPEELAAELFERFTVERLELDWNAAEASVDDAQADVSQDIRRTVYDRSRPAYVPGRRLTYHVPFTGHAWLFKAQPNIFGPVHPQGEVSGRQDRRGELVLSATAAAGTSGQLKGQVDAEAARVKQWVAYVNEEVDEFNARLSGTLLAAVEQRRRKVLDDNELLGSLGMPVRRREDAAPTYVPDKLRRTAARPAERNPVAQRPVPFMPAEEYDHVLDIIRGFAVVMERSPKAFRTLGEEDLRQHLLARLNDQYRGGATGETFNFEGKTDILVREADRNIFIGECKFWSGPTTLSRAIDQLLGYASWRDTKTAIIVLNRRRALSHVLAQVVPTVRAHPNFVREIPSRHRDTEFCFVVRNRDDPDRELTLTVLVFEVPR